MDDVALDEDDSTSLRRSKLPGNLAQRCRCLWVGDLPSFRSSCERAIDAERPHEHGNVEDGQDFFRPCPKVDSLIEQQPFITHRNVTEEDLRRAVTERLGMGEFWSINIKEDRCLAARNKLNGPSSATIRKARLARRATESLAETL